MSYNPYAAGANMPQIPQPNGWAGKMSGMAGNNQNMLLQLGLGLLDKRQNNNVRFTDIGQQAMQGRQMDQETQNRNMTKEWLMRVKGLSEQDAQAAMASPVVLAEMMKGPKAPISVSKGETLLNPDTMEPLYQGQSEQPNSYQEWQLAQGNPGYAKHLQGPESNKLQMFGRGDTGYDPQTQEFITPPNAGAPDAEALAKREAELRGEYTKLPQFKRFDEIHASYERVRAAAESDSGPGDLALLTGYMKMIDPGSSVKEGEFANAENASGIPAFVRNMYNKAMTGERLDGTMRQEFLDAAQNLYETEAATMTELDTRYDALATQGGVSPDNVTIMNIPKYARISLPDLEAEARRRGLVK